MMPDSLYPKEFAEWVALMTAVIPLIALSGSAASFALAAFWRALVHRQERKEHDWKRLHSLVEILNNKDGKYFTWTQIAAIREMETLTVTRSAARSVAKVALSFWSVTNAKPEIIRELERFIAISHPFFVVRLFRKLTNP